MLSWLLLVHMMCSSTGSRRHDSHNSRALENSNADPLCDCYDIKPSQIAYPRSAESACYTYSIVFHSEIASCSQRPRARRIILGKCEGESPHWNRRKIDSSLLNIHPSQYHAKAIKTARHSLVGLEVSSITDADDREPSISMFDDEEITICMQHVNVMGVTSNNVQLELLNEDVISCFDSASLSGLPCLTDDYHDHGYADANFTVVEIDDEDEMDHLTQPLSIAPSSAPTLLPTLAPTHDVCILFDQSCNLSASQCAIFNQWLSDFVKLLFQSRSQHGQQTRLCLLGVAAGVEVLIDLDSVGSSNEHMLVELIQHHTCGNSSYNLLDALEVVGFVFETKSSSDNDRSMVIFNNCPSMQTERELCDWQQTSWPAEDVRVFVVNIQSIDGSPAGNTRFLPSGDIDGSTYLDCFTISGGEQNVVSITQANYQTAGDMLRSLANDLSCDRHSDGDGDGDGDVDGDADGTQFQAAVKVEQFFKNMNMEIMATDTTQPTYRWAQAVFLVVIAVIVCNAGCCIFCSLRKSGALDALFGAHDKDDETDDEFADEDDDKVIKVCSRTKRAWPATQSGDVRGDVECPDLHENDRLYTIAERSEEEDITADDGDDSEQETSEDDEEMDDIQLNDDEDEFFEEDDDDRNRDRYHSKVFHQRRHPLVLHGRSTYLMPPNSRYHV